MPISREAGNQGSSLNQRLLNQSSTCTVCTTCKTDVTYNFSSLLNRLIRVGPFFSSIWAQTTTSTRGGRPRRPRRPWSARPSAGRWTGASSSRGILPYTSSRSAKKSLAPTPPHPILFSEGSPALRTLILQRKFMFC